MAYYLSLGVIKKKNPNKQNTYHKPITWCVFVTAKILDQSQAVQLLQESIGLFYSCGATGGLGMERNTVWFSRNRAVCEGHTGGLEGNLHQGGSARIWERLEDFSDRTVTLAYGYFLDGDGGKLSANPMQS